MSKLIQILLLLSIILTPSYSLAENDSNLFSDIDQKAFFPMGEWKLQEKFDVDNYNYFLQRWKNSSENEIILKCRSAMPHTIQSVYQAIGQDVDRDIAKFGGSIIVLMPFFSIFAMNDDPSHCSINILYGTPEGAYWWKYKVLKNFKIDFKNYIEKITLAAREHQYVVAAKNGNVIMGRWGDSIYEFAKLLLNRNDPRTISVYKALLKTNPSKYHAQIEYASISKNKEEAKQCALIVKKNAEEKELLDAAALVLKNETPNTSPKILSKKDNGLSVILIPIEPCNPWLLDEIAAAYEEITSIPVVIRRLPVKMPRFEPSRSVYRSHLENIASNIWKTKSDFNDWSLSKLKSEIMEIAKKEGPQAVTSINFLFKKMDEAGYQWDCDPIRNWLSQAIVPYYSNDPNTMVVGITELNIFAGNSNFVFSSFGGLRDTPVSILSYAIMTAKLTGEKQSRKRLVKRAAKELVPASLKKLNIPRSTDPSCPYSYSDGLQRLDEKTLDLSESVKKEIARIKNSIQGE